MATQRKHKRRSPRQKGRFFRLYILLSALLIAAAVVAGSVVFFRAHDFVVEGNERYSAEELLEASGIQEGENLLLIPCAEIAGRMERELPYLRQVTVSIWPPERVILRVEETQPAAVVDSGGTLWYIDSEGKLLERASESGGLTEVSGLTLLSPSEGTQLAVSEEEDLKARALLALLTALEEREMISNAQSVDLTSSSTVVMRYDGRLTVRMGLGDDFDYDVKMLQSVLTEYIDVNWAEDDTGTLDMTQEEGEAVLSRDD